MEADTGQVAKALCSMSVQPGPKVTPKFSTWIWVDFSDVQDFTLDTVVKTRIKRIRGSFEFT